MITKNEAKRGKKYCCKKCDYSCKDKYNMRRHLASTKHQMVTNGNKNEAKRGTLKCKCGKVYKFRSGLSRHKKKCTMQFQHHGGDHGPHHNEKLLKKNVTDSHKSQEMEELYKRMENSVLKNTGVSSDFCKIMQDLVEDNCRKTELMEKILDQNSALIPKVGSNNNNNISINVFLNEHCAGAMNLGDFVENVKVTLDDLLYTKDNGYVKGISNIFVKHLTDMEPTERPIQCSDKKRLQFYVKEEDTWQKDKEHEKINKSIQNVSVKQIKKLKEWENLHPDYLTDKHLMSQWHEMIQKITGGVNVEEREKNTENIKKGILNTVDMKNAMV